MCLAKDAHERPADARKIAKRLRAITVPPEHAWTGELARRWWADVRPMKAPERGDGEVQVLVADAVPTPELSSSVTAPDASVFGPTSAL